MNFSCVNKKYKDSAPLSSTTGNELHIDKLLECELPGSVKSEVDMTEKQAQNVSANPDVQIHNNEI